MSAQGSGTRTRVTLTGLNRNTSDFKDILLDIGQGFYFSGSAQSNFCFNYGFLKFLNLTGLQVGKECSSFSCRQQIDYGSIFVFTLHQIKNLQRNSCVCFWEGLKSQVSLLYLCTLKLYILDKNFNSLSLLKQKVDYADLEK